MKRVTNRSRIMASSLTTKFVISASVAVMAALAPLAAASDAAAQSARVSSTSASQAVRLGLNKSLVLDLPTDAYDILVANPEVADAVSRTARRIYLFGKQVGQTNIFVFGPNGEQIASLDITIERDVAGLEEHLSRFIENSDIKAELINDNVVLTGTVQTPLDAKRAVQLAEIFVKGGEATTGNYASSQNFSSNNGSVSFNLSGSESRRTSQIVNLLQIVGQDQVTLKVTVAEISRNVMKQLGVNLIARGASGDGITFGTITDNFAGLGKPLATAAVSSLAGDIGSVNLQSYFNAMESAGVMKTLAEPTLTAISGEQATFRVGGEFNLVTGQNVDGDTGALTYEITKLDYGIGLEFLPVVLSPGRISLKIRTTVSEPTSEGSVALGAGVRTQGANLISIRKRLADTTVELPSGGSMMIAGLVRDDIRQQIAGLPGMKNIPVLGTLFRSRDFVRNETELVILVTPYLVRPVARNKLAKPDDNFNAASDGAGNFLSRVNRVYGTMKTDLPNGRYHGVVGYIYK
ncbi:MAG: type II and III secretion system protein family protein [Brucellaceae bacterium]|nr:type II and III secretion system protein family protein [Brucellaceae bacterium]